MDELDIQKQLQKFNVTEAGIAELKSKYGSLAISNADDKEGYKAVRAARLDMKARRVEVDKKRKELTEDANRYQRAINAEASRIISLIHPLEDELFGKEEWFVEENERIKREAAEAEEAKIRARVQSLLDLEMRFDSVAFTSQYTITPLMMRDVKTKTDVEFESIRDQISCLYTNFKLERDQKQKEASELKAKQEAEAKAEQEELARLRIKAETEARELRAQQEAEFKREQEILAEQRKAIAEREAVLKAESELLERQKEEQAKSIPVPSPAGTCRADVEAPKESEITQDIYVRPDKTFFVEMSGRFSVLHQVEGKDEDAAKDNALNDLHHMKNEMGIDFDVEDIEVSGDEE